MKTYVFLNAVTGEVAGIHTCSEQGADDWVLYYTRKYGVSFYVQPAGEFHVRSQSESLAA